MPYDDDEHAFAERDSHARKLLDISDELSERSTRAIRQCDDAVKRIKRLMGSSPVPPRGDKPAMEWDITREEEPGLTVVRARGSFSVPTSWSKVADLAAEKDPLCPALFDGRDMEVAHLTSSDLIEIESILQRHMYAFLFCKIGILVTDGAVRDLAEQWSRLASAGNPYSIAVFTDEPAAREWLAES